jgi:large subunit ribosomal protein L30e
LIDFEGAVKTVFKTGKAVIGGQQALSLIKTGRAKLVILASNCPEGLKKEIQYCARLSSIPVYSSSTPSQDLKRICAKPFTVSVISVRDPGDSEILKLAEESYVK